MLSKVADLIDLITGKWDDELVRDTFWREDVSMTLALPVHREMEDAIAWHF